jgi:signal transduction histidine kinase
MPQSAHIGRLSHEGAVVGTVTVVDDVSDRLATEIALRKQIEAQRRARATAEQALHAKDEFLSTLSHEMRTPLNAVLGWARILLDRQTLDHALVQRALQVIERNASAQAKMIDDMLDMARIVSGKLRLEMKTVDVVSIVLAAVDVIMPSADARKIAIRTHVDPKSPLIVGDPDRLQQVIVNLLSNAVKFTDVGGSIEVRLDLSDTEACLVVKDTGRGIDPAFLPHVFERFRQGDASSTRRHGGLGLGLALVRDLVELHGGAVSAQSDGEGKGARFTVRLPAHADKKRAAA